jgi:hypothetical protein
MLVCWLLDSNCAGNVCSAAVATYTMRMRISRSLRLTFLMIVNKPI